MNLDNKLEFLTRKVGWLDLIGLALKCLIIYFYEAALKAEGERKALIEKQRNEAKQGHKAEVEVNKPSEGIVL